jgi:acetyltransferase-like isoleucine patch superfamily enzyme
MTDQDSPRTLPWDWYPGTIPNNVVLDDNVYIETSFSFLHYRSRASVGLRIGRGTCVYAGTMFDVGVNGQVRIGDYGLLNGAMIFCDAAVEIGDYALISWNVVLMDNYRLSWHHAERRQQLRQAATLTARRFEVCTEPQSIRIEANVWIGFNTCVMPGVTIGEGAIVGARSLVLDDVAPYTIVGGNPARFIRHLDPAEHQVSDSSTGAGPINS